MFTAFLTRHGWTDPRAFAIPKDGGVIILGLNHLRLGSEVDINTPNKHHCLAIEVAAPSTIRGGDVSQRTIHAVTAAARNGEPVLEMALNNGAHGPIRAMHSQD